MNRGIDLDRIREIDKFLDDLSTWVTEVRERKTLELVVAFYVVWPVVVALTALWLSTGLMAWLEGKG